MHGRRSLPLAVLSAALLAPTALSAPTAPPIVLDGLFDDWEGRPAVVLDAEDNPAGPVDIRAVHVSDDPAFLHLRVDLGRAVNLQRLDGRLLLLVDGDGSSETGLTQYGLDGVDAVVEFTPVDNRRGDRPGMGVGVRLPGPAARTVSPYEWGVAFAPTYAAREAEIRLERGASLGGGPPMLTGETAVLKLVVLDPTGTPRDEVETVTYRFTHPFGGVLGGTVAVDPGVRAPGTAVRVVSWNGERGALFSRPQHFARVLVSARSDVVAFQELTDQQSAESVAAWLNANVPAEADGRPWTAVFGAGGGNLRTAVATRLPMRPVEGFDRLVYTDDRGRQRDVRAAFAHIEVEGRTLLVVSIHLKCCGSAGSGEDFVRAEQVEAIRGAVATIVRRDGVDGVVVCGDYNLVGSRAILDRMTEGLGERGGDGTVAVAPQLDGRSLATWADPKQPFTPGQLDFVVFGGALRQTGGFVLDAADLDAASRNAAALASDETARASDHLPVVVDLAWTSAENATDARGARGR